MVRKSAISDVLIKLDAITQDYDFDGVKFSPLAEFMTQLKIMMARYRIGDGTEAVIVTPGLQNHPNHQQTLWFQQLIKLGQSLEQ